MKNQRVIRNGALVSSAVALSLGLLVSFSVSTLAQEKTAPSNPPASQSAASKPTPRTPDGHPDFSGFYNLADVYHGDPKEEKPGQHVVTRASENGSSSSTTAGQTAAQEMKSGARDPADAERQGQYAGSHLRILRRASLQARIHGQGESDWRRHVRRRIAA